MSQFRWQTLAASIALLFLIGCTLLLRPPASLTNPHLLLGNPSQATSSLSTPDNYLIEKPQYALSYSNSQHIPNWVSWQLNASWLGEVQRRNDFRPDDGLPQGWYRVTPSDYNGSGFDRGHMTPSADRSNSPENNSATFLMTNILPQAPDNNQGPWAELENYCRDLVRQGKELYIIAGGYGRKRTIAPRAKSVETKGKSTDYPNGGTALHRIVAPARVWKVIVVLDQPGRGLQGVTNKTRVIAVDMPNVQGIREDDWRTFQVSVAAIEAKTGYNLLSNLPADLQKTLENRDSMN